MFLARGHDVHAGDARYRAYRLDHFDADVAPFETGICRLLQAPDDFVRNVDAWNFTAQPARGLGRAYGANADEDVAAFMQPFVAHTLHV